MKMGKIEGLCCSNIDYVQLVQLSKLKLESTGYQH